MMQPAFMRTSADPAASASQLLQYQFPLQTLLWCQSLSCLAVLKISRMTATSSACMKLLVVVTLLACINVASAASVDVRPLALNAERTDASSPRFLRANVVEERKLAVSLPGLEQAASGTKSWAAKIVQKLQLKWWQLRKKSPNDVFTKLKLDKTGGNLFENAGFSKWAAYVTKNSKEAPEMAIFSTLALHYTDDALAKMLLAAKDVEGTKALATKLEGLQLTNWVQAGKSPDDVFKILMLDQAGAKVFDNPQFVRWTDFVAKANTKNSDVAMYVTLGTHYSDDALAAMFAAAKDVGSTKALATKLEGIQLTNWANAEKSTDNVFNALKLDKTGEKLFESPALSTWTSYVAKTQKDPDAIMVALLKESYGDVALSKMIASATKAASTEKLATDLRSVQFKNWAAQGRTPEHVNTMLKVATNSDDLTKKVSRDYEKFYGKLKVTDTAANRPAGNGIRIDG
ncbi:hypothetical protein PHYPSEUDO_002033 [Phytophthora pseudosyringae]|uniref:RxLR effector PexRD54 WY domain-containing protein n=1 Tax=Phytophthora pseudosyringae TaxID=221518 RepID=A0A8T1VUW8_9STRA|nr:hypothetical protein PHYPSEUDO_002033 [Phytophthora pseudosyringae]